MYFRTTLAFVLVLAIPTPTFAAFSSAHEALGALRHTGNPREFSAQAHNTDGNTFLSTWVQGVQEGKGDWLKLRMDATAHMKQGRDLIQVRMRALVHQNTLYYTISDVKLDTEDTLTKTQLTSMLTKWVAMPLPASVDAMSSWNFVDILEAVHMDIVSIAPAWNDVRTNVGTFSMEHTGYQGGNAYSIYPTSSDMNVHIKLNTTKDGSFTYGKYYMQRANFVFEGKMQPLGSSVYLDIPKDTVSPEEFDMHLLGFEFPMMYSDVPLATPTPEKTVREIQPVRSAQPEIPETRSYVEYAKRSGNAQEERYSCAWPGTLDAVELERKGICPKEKLTKRDIRTLEYATLNGTELRENRIEQQRILDHYNTSAQQFETHAHMRKMHFAKSMLERSMLTTGSDEVNAWLEESILPFYIPMLRSTVVRHLPIENLQGKEGMALEKMVTMETGRRKSVVIMLTKPDMHSKPVITDVYLNAKLQDLLIQGIIE